MRIDLKMVEVDGTIFISGTNLGPKIDAKSKTNVPNEMYYDTETQLTYIIHKGETWMGKAKGMILQNGSVKAGIALSHSTQHNPNVKAQASGPGAALKMNAQVETPLDKVQGTPRRKSKYQGEAN